MSTQPTQSPGQNQQQGQWSQSPQGGYSGSPMAPAGGYGAITQKTEGEKYANISLILGIVAFFFFGVILGIIAVIYAKKAEDLGVAATPGKVLGWINIILGAIFFVFFIFFFVILGAAGISSQSG